MLNVPLSIYVHIPWCIKKCPYCDFNSHQVRTSLPESEYIDALIVDAKQQASIVKKREIKSIFIGGGTPSLFTAQGIQRLLMAFQKHYLLSNNVEITIEANPGTYDEKNFEGYLAAGVNRISIGVQSFTEKLLQSIGRIHSAQIAANAIKAAKSSGFENINLDLMYALPEQTLQEAAYDIEQAISFNPAHISYYQLTLEPNTHFYRHPPKLPDNDESWNIHQQGVSLLTRYGFQQYEISAYAKTAKECVHNKNYWQFGDYVGIGAGAHQKISDMDQCRVIRSEKPHHPQQYIRHILNNEKNLNVQELRKEDLQFEFLLNALRMKQGFNKEQYERYTGLEFDSLITSLQDFQEDNLLVFQNETVQCTQRGFRFLDNLLQRLLPATA